MENRSWDGLSFYEVEFYLSDQFQFILLRFTSSRACCIYEYKTIEIRSTIVNSFQNKWIHSRFSEFMFGWETKTKEASYSLEKLRHYAWSLAIGYIPFFFPVTSVQLAKSTVVFYQENHKNIETFKFPTFLGRCTRFFFPPFFLSDEQRRWFSTTKKIRTASKASLIEQEWRLSDKSALDIIRSVTGDSWSLTRIDLRLVDTRRATHFDAESKHDRLEYAVNSGLLKWCPIDSLSRNLSKTRKNIENCGGVLQRNIFFEKCLSNKTAPIAKHCQFFREYFN